MTAPITTPEALLPCPFCGSGAKLFGTDFEGYLHCTNDACAVQPSTYSKKIGRAQSLTAAWNTRSTAPVATVKPPAGSVAVCAICDIAGCYHIREAQAQPAAPVDLASIRAEVAALTAKLAQIGAAWNLINEDEGVAKAIREAMGKRLKKIGGGNG